MGVRVETISDGDIFAFCDGLEEQLNWLLDNVDIARTRSDLRMDFAIGKVDKTPAMQELAKKLDERRPA